MQKTKIQCCESGSASIRINLAVLDPEQRNLPQLQINLFFLAFHKGFSSLTSIQIRMDPHWFGFLDPEPDPH